MIIEAGYDLGMLFAPKLFRRRTEPRRGMWALALDGDLKFVRLERVGGAIHDNVQEQIPRIVHALRTDPFPVVYYAFGRLDPEYKNEDLETQDEILRSAPELADFELLGSYLSNGRVFSGSIPRYSFRDYPALEHLPRPAICPGPHELITCECLSCTQFEARLAGYRAAHEERQRVPLE